MNFSKVKLIIIVCLLAVNILFGVLCIRLYYDRSYIPEEEAMYASAHLEKNGLYVEFDTELRKKYNLPIYLIETDAAKTVEIYKSITENFFERQVASVDYVTTPEGHSVSVKNSDGELYGTALLTNNINVECVKEQKIGIVDRQELSKNIHYFEDKLSVNKAEEKLAENLLKKALGAYGLEYKLCGSAKYGDGCIVFFGCELSDAHVIDLYLNVYVKDSEVVYCTGNIVSGIPAKAYSINLIDAVDAMYLLLRNNEVQKAFANGDGVEVTDVKMIYKTLEYEQNGYYVIPAWYIEYTGSDGTENSIVFDAVVGESEYIPY